MLLQESYLGRRAGQSVGEAPSSLLPRQMLLRINNQFFEFFSRSGLQKLLYRGFFLHAQQSSEHYNPLQLFKPILGLEVVDVIRHVIYSRDGLRP